MAAQTLVDEAYAKADVGADTVQVGEGKTITVSEIADLAEVKGEIGTVKVLKGKVTELEYTKSGKKCTYKADGTGDDGKYTVAKQ